MKKGTRRASPAFFLRVIFFSTVFVVLKLFRPISIDPFTTAYISNSLIWHGSSDREICNGTRVYMYDLPPEFNVGLHDGGKCNHSLIPWLDLCSRFENGGYGSKLWGNSFAGRDLWPPSSSGGDDDVEFDLSGWYDTDSYMLEVIFHDRMKAYGCLTTDPSAADAFFVPYYAGLHALVHLYAAQSPGGASDVNLSHEKRKEFGTDLVAWLDRHGGDTWRRHGGRDHFLVLGRTTWDFKLGPEWGTGFSALPYVANMTRLLIEKDPFEAHEVGIPYATSFHPESPKTLRAWIDRVGNAERRFLFAYVGAPRSDNESVRGIVGSSCVNAGDAMCKFVNCSIVTCSHDPLTIHKAFLQSTFCLQPRGDSATRRSIFDCLISGAIPVFFHEHSAYAQYSWHLPRRPESYSVFIHEDDLRKGVSIQQVLTAYAPDQIGEMRRTIVSMIPHLLYNDYASNPWSPSSSKDAFELSVENVLQRIAVLKNSSIAHHPRGGDFE